MIAVIILAGGVIALFYIYELSHNVALGWVSLLAVSLYNFSFGTGQAFLGGLHLDAMDGVLICLIIAGVIRTIARIEEPHTPRFIAFCYLALFFVGYVRGVFEYGFPAASNESRGYAGTLTCFLYFLTAPVDRESIRKYVRIYMFYGCGLLVTAVLAYAGLDVGSEAWAHHADISNGINGRLLPAGAGAALATCFLFSAAQREYRRSNVWARLLPLLFLGMAIYLRHRTVWAMLAGSVFCLVVVEPRIFRRLLPAFAGIAAILLALILFTPNIANENANQFQDAAKNSGTWEWRLNSWRELVWDEDQTTPKALLGRSMGSGYWRFDPAAGTYTNLPPHNEYVAQYMRVGVVGVVCLVWFLAWPVAKFLRQSRWYNLAIDPSAGIWLVILIAIMVYGLPYSITSDLYAIAGFANAIVVNAARHAADHVEEIAASPELEIEGQQKP